MRAACAAVAVLVGCSFDNRVTALSDAGIPIEVGFERASSVEDEASGTVMLPVSLNAAAGAPVTVDFTVSDGSANRGLDYDADPSGTLTFAPGETTHYIPITIIADDLEEGNETLRIRLKNVSGAKLGTDDHQMTINSVILPRVRFTLLTSSGPENGPVVQLNLALDVASPVDVRVDFTLSGNAKVVDDYVFTAQTITFPAGETTRQIDLTPMDDLLDEDDEQAIVTLANPQNVIIKPMEGTRVHTLIDDDPTPTITFGASTATGTEGGADVNLTLTLSAVSGRDVTVPFSAVATGTFAAAATDYTVLTASPILIPAGTPSVNIVVKVENDALDEFDETFNVVLGTLVNADPGAITTCTFSIGDDDPEPSVMFDPMESDGAALEGNNGNPKAMYKVKLSAPSGKLIQVPINLSGTATEVADYMTSGIPVTFAPEDVEETITLDIVPDVLPEANETIIMSIPNNGGLTNVRQGSPAQRTHTITNDD